MTRSQRFSPALLVLLIAGILLAILLVARLDYGLLHTDVTIIRAWFREVGIEGFPQRYFEINQRHFLVGPLYALAYRFFGEADLPYNVIFHAARLLNGVFLAAIVQQIVHRPALAFCAGLALTVTPIRVHELFQGINWFIEPTLTLLLASTYTYALSLRSNRRGLWYLLSLALYVLSILIYESGLPWLAVNVVVGYLLRPNMNSVQRLGRAMLDALPSLVAAAVIAYLILFQFTPWSGLAPSVGGGLIERVIKQLLTPITFLQSYLQEWQTTRDYYGLVAICTFIAAVIVVAVTHWLWRRDEDEQQSTSTDGDYLALALVGMTMVAAGTLVGASGQLYIDYLDRITFGRAAGIMLLWVTLIFALCSRLKLERLAPLIAAILLIGPGTGWLFSNQQYALRAREDIVRMTAALLEVGRVIYPPAYAVVITPPDWSAARFLDGSDVILLEVQQKLWDTGSPLRIDLLRTGAFPESYATIPGTCETVWGESSSGLCLDADHVVANRWLSERNQPYSNVVVMRYDERAAKLTVIPEIQLIELTNAGYNITSAGEQTLRTNPERVAVPLPYSP